jgi:hypothetical protein
MQYQFDNGSRVPVAVVHCLDWRFVQQTWKFITKELGVLFFTPYSFPGGPKVFLDLETRNVFLRVLETVSIGHHGIQQVILIGHRDCKAYGGSARFGSPEEERETHERDLRIARDVITRKFPGVMVDLFYMEIVSMAGGEGKVEPQQVK